MTFGIQNADPLSMTEALEKMISKSHAQEVAALNHNVPVFLPWEDHIQAQVVPSMLLSALFLTIIHTVAYILLGMRGSGVGASSSTSSSASSSSVKLSSQQRHLISYRVTNFVANTCLCIMGLYYCAMLPPLVPPQNTITGGQDLLHFLGSFQLGYQLWALPVGVYLVHEPPHMLLHHLAVVMVSGMSSLFTNGFRYWTPYFYGVFEMSSIPLAVMNAFKDNQDWMDAYPGLYLFVRMLFAVTFLGVRVAHCTPRHVAFLIEHYYLWSSSASDNVPYFIFMAIVWMCSAFLLLLNLHWGFIIAKGMVKQVRRILFSAPSKSNKQKTA